MTRPIVILVIHSAITALACSPNPTNDRVEAQYDKESGKLSQLTVDAKKDGKPNIFSYMDGTKFVRIEIDNDEDGKIDRWEYYGSGQTVERVGVSRANDGVADSWAYPGEDGVVRKVEISTRRDGKVNRTEFYEQGKLARAEEDSDADGRLDKWETYVDGALASVSFDTTHSGKPTRTIHYRQTATAP